MIPQAERRRHHQKARRSSPARGAGSCQAFAIEGGSDGAERSGRSGWLCVRSAGRSVQGQARGYAAQSFMVHLRKLRKPLIVRLLTQPMSKLARLLSAAQNMPSAGDAPTADLPAREPFTIDGKAPMRSAQQAAVCGASECWGFVPSRIRRRGCRREARACPGCRHFKGLDGLGSGVMGASRIGRVLRRLGTAHCASPRANFG